MAILTSAPTGLPERLLIVEDSPSDRRLIKEMAVDAGVAPEGVVCAESLGEARRLLTDSPSDCVLLDLSLPDAVGLEAVAVMAAAAPDVPVVVITGNGADTLVYAAMAEGADEYLAKSELDAAHLQDVLIRARQRRLGRQTKLRQTHSASIVLDSIDAPTVALDGSGRIVATNRAWMSAGSEAGTTVASIGVGVNYLTVCDQAVGLDTEGAAETAAGIRDVLRGEAERFATDYPCHSQAGDRWYSVRVTPIGELGGGAVVTHLDITHLKLAEYQLRQKEALLTSISDDNAPIFGVWGLDGTVKQVSDTTARIFGLDSDTVPGQKIMSRVDPQDFDRAQAVYQRVASSPGWTERLQVRVIDHSGASRQLDLALSNRIDDPSVEGVVVTGADITEGHFNQIARRLETRLLQNLPAAVTVTDDRGVVVYWNDRAASMFGFSSEEAVGRPIAELHIAPTGVDGSAIMQAVRGAGRWEGDFDAVRADGSPIPVHMTLEHIDDPDIGFHGVVGASVDIRERRQLEENLAFQALHDPVTGLPNRRLFVQHLERALSRASRSEKRTAVLFIDLDDFKMVNDRIGHAAGDQVLHRVGAQIAGVLRAGDLVARLGGDEFVVCCDDLYSPDEAYIVAKRIIKALADSFQVGTETTKATASIGIALSGPGSRPEGLVRNADMAMYAAKQTGKARVELFDDALHDQVRTRHALAVELEQALEEGQIETLFQPQVALATGALIGFEALARWRHPDRGMVPPMEFIPVAEESGLIGRLGIAVLESSCRALQSWLATSPGTRLSVAVNVSARQLVDPDFPNVVRRVLEETGVPARSVCLEVTESSLEDADVVDTVLWELKNLGVEIAIDDFGTGYSSLSRLHRFPLDYLKIDRSFVSGMSHRTEDAVIVSCVLALARGLGVRTVAEGIEDVAQREQLVAAGCEFAQGWLWSPAIPADKALELVRTDRPLPEAGPTG